PATARSAAATVAAPASAGIAVAGTVATAASTAPPPFAFDKLSLGDAVNAGHEVTHATDRFAAGDNTLYASVATVGSSSNATLNAKWSYLEGRGQVVSSISQSLATDGPAITTFKVHNPDLWPEGRYQVDVSIDGKPSPARISPSASAECLRIAFFLSPLRRGRKNGNPRQPVGSAHDQWCRRRRLRYAYTGRRPSAWGIRMRLRAVLWMLFALAALPLPA